MELISIVIPIYNAEKFLRRCLDSILSQSFREFKVILIDDGSKDKSSDICWQYANKDNRFQVIYQENCGPSAARNTGLKYVNGKYLCFMDADDAFATEKALAILYEHMESINADLCIYGWNIIEQTNNTITSYTFKTDEMQTDSKCLLKILMEGNYRGGGGNPWNKIWRIDSLKEDGEIHKFDTNIHIYEDMLWVIQGVQRINRITYLNTPLYEYYILDGSLSRNNNPVEGRKKFAQGAQRVYEYICENCVEVEREARFWYRDRYSKYLWEKTKARIRFSEKEIETLRCFSFSPREFSSIKVWIRFVLVSIRCASFIWKR